MCAHRLLAHKAADDALRRKLTVVEYPLGDEKVWKDVVVDWLNVRTKMSVDGFYVRRFTLEEFG